MTNAIILIALVNSMRHIWRSNFKKKALSFMLTIPFLIKIRGRHPHLMFPISNYILFQLVKQEFLINISINQIR